MLSLCIATSLLLSQDSAPKLQIEDLHPAFKKEALALSGAWEKGEKESASKKDTWAVVDKFKRGIGSVKSGLVRSETVSWLYFFPPEVVCYHYGFITKKKYMSEEEVSAIKKALAPPESVHMTSITFYGTLSILPSFGRAYGQISRHADPEHLKDVRVVLKVGEKIIQPIEQPGDLMQASGQGVNSTAIPFYTYEQTRSTATGSAYGSGGYVHGSATGTSTTVRQHVRVSEETYDWYQGQFTVDFKLFDKEGKPVITKNDKEFTVIVIYGPNERKATYKLDQLVKPL